MKWKYHTDGGGGMSPCFCMLELITHSPINIFCQVPYLWGLFMSIFTKDLLMRGERSNNNCCYNNACKECKLSWAIKGKFLWLVNNWRWILQNICLCPVLSLLSFNQTLSSQALPVSVSFVIYFFYIYLEAYSIVDIGNGQQILTNIYGNFMNLQKNIHVCLFFLQFVSIVVQNNNMQLDNQGINFIVSQAAKHQGSIYQVSINCILWSFMP